MSKKSRRRNRKILGALAAGLGAAALMRGRGEISSNRTSGIDSALRSMKSTAKVVPDAISGPSRDVKRNMKSIFVNDDGSITKGTRTFPNKEAYSSFMQASRKPKSLRAPGQTGIMSGDLGGAFDYLPMKKGGRVTGAAKRGFGRALMKKGRKK